MRILNFTSDKDNITVKQILSNVYSMKASVITALKNSGGILVNENVATVRETLNRGDTLKLIIPEKQTSDIVPVKGDLDVLYEDDDILCVNKKRGMPTHPSQNHHDDTLANIVCNYYKDITFTFRVSNRLDNYTSGVVIIAKNMYSASYLCTKEFGLSVNKTYYAVCRGSFKENSGEIIAPICRCENSTIKRTVSPKGKYAHTVYEVILEKNNISLVKVMPQTGRTHQIRVHMAHIGHPLVNDFLYDENFDGVNKFLLHCKTMEFVHPCSKTKLNIDSVLPDEYNTIFD